MAKGTPKATKTATPSKPASATKGMPKSAGPDSASKKRVRLADDADVKPAGDGTPSKGTKPVKGALKKSDAATATSDSKGKGKGKKLEPEPAADGGDGESDDEEEIDFLEGFESGDEDSSDEEMEDDEPSKPAFDLVQLPKVKGETVQKKLGAKEKKQVRHSRGSSAALCISRD